EYHLMSTRLGQSLLTIATSIRSCRNLAHIGPRSRIRSVELSMIQTQPTIRLPPFTPVSERHLKLRNNVNDIAGHVLTWSGSTMALQLWESSVHIHDRTE